MIGQDDGAGVSILHVAKFIAPDRWRRIRRVLPVLLCAAVSTSASPPPGDLGAGKGVVTLSNDRIILRVDPTMGGAITYLASVRDPNLVNDHDLGREIQQSYYSGPKPFGHPVGTWAQFGWNPIGSGDNLGHRASAQVTVKNGHTVYVRSIPYQWALDRVTCDCSFESWMTLVGNQVRVHQRLTNSRSDHAQYGADMQEVPAIYVNTFARRVATYSGAHPFRGDVLTRMPGEWPPKNLLATENWVALVDDRDRGLGVVNVATDRIDAGVTDQRDGDEHSGQTGYISPRQQDILDHNIVYDTYYTLVVGSVSEIRAAALALKPQDTRPDYLFRRDRQGWSYVNAKDSGWPITGWLHVVATQADPQMIGPARAFFAADVPALYITAAFTGGTEAQLYWATADQPGFAETRSLKIPVLPDGRVRTIRIPAGSMPGWTGLVTQLRVDPPGAAGAHADICAIAWHPVAC